MARTPWLLVVPVVVVAACSSSSNGGGLADGGSGSSTASGSTQTHSGSASGGPTSSSGASGTLGPVTDGGTSTGSSSGGSSTSSSGATDSDGGAAVGTNTVPVVVNNGPSAAGGSNNVPFVTVTVCVPGSSTDCATIDFVSVDTGSSGLRLIASALPSSFTLPQVMASTGDPLGECFSFGDGTTWGSVRSADLQIGGEIAHNIPIQLMGDPAYAAAPSSCSSYGLEDTSPTADPAAPRRTAMASLRISRVPEAPATSWA